MLLTVDVSKYERLIKLAKENEHRETAFRVPLSYLEEVKVWLVSKGYNITPLLPITNVGYANNALDINYQRLLVDWRHW